jgi:L-ascorbate metabolism protein UlaG (beta-lactamase superfamily)
MKITKYVHSCLLVEMPAPINRTTLFDPGVMSEDAVPVEQLEYLDDIIITHNHTDHMSMPLIKRLVAKFPEVRITATPEAVEQLQVEGIKATASESEGIVFFKSEHEDVAPLFPQPQQIGVHYLDRLTDPGDGHSFTETKEILALPITAPWGSAIKAVQLAMQLRPKYVLPIHDWHWRDEAQQQMYEGFESLFKAKDITFFKPQTGQPIVIDD